MSETIQNPFKLVSGPAFEAEYGDFENMVNKVYGVKNFSLPADLEMRNDETFVVSLDVNPLDEFEESDLRDFVQTGRGEGMTYVLMQDMVNRGILLPGKYIINVSW